MKVEKIDKDPGLRMKLGEGKSHKGQFIVSLLMEGDGGILIEFDNDKFLITLEELVFEALNDVHKISFFEIVKKDFKNLWSTVRNKILRRRE